MKIYDEFKDRRDDFEILAFHDQKAKDIADLESKIEKLKNEVWGRDLPFPILMDDTGETLKLFGITGFPTIILIDPAGKVVKDGGEETLRQHLEESSRKGKKAQEGG